jgi:putative phosphoesterase
MTPTRSTAGRRSSAERLLVAVLSDTHMPKGERRLPEECARAIAGADLAIHAGDISTVAVLREIEAIGPPVVAVHGNVDEPELREELAESVELDIEGWTVAVVHDASPAKGRTERLRLRFPDADAVIFGHSHLPLHEYLDGFQIFNPGSPTERRRSPEKSMGLLTVTPTALGFRHLWLGT